VGEVEEFGRPNTAPQPWNKQNWLADGIVSNEEMNARLSK
jgi:hypothetical protein